MIRLLLVEQLYRAFTINNHEKYHHLWVYFSSIWY
jgi:23S rRNA pseudoU1915 N3-methylase RlmH